MEETTRDFNHDDYMVEDLIDEEDVHTDEVKEEVNEPAPTEREVIYPDPAEVEDHPAQGTPVPTNELNPDNPCRENIFELDPGMFGGNSGGPSLDDYTPLFETYNKAFEQQDKDITSLKSAVEELIVHLSKCQHKLWEVRVYSIILTILGIIYVVIHNG